MEGSILATSVNDIEYIKFIGTIRYSHCGGLESHIEYLFDGHDYKQIVIDLEEADILDSTALGLLAKIAIQLKNTTKVSPIIFLKTGELANIIKRVCFDQVFQLIFNGELQPFEALEELVSNEQDEKQVLQRVIDAHESLAILSEKNRQLYKDITCSLG